MNWITITEDDLPAVIAAKARTIAQGANDAIPAALSEGISRVRRAVAPGNSLDADFSTVPTSLKGVATRIALFDLMVRIRMTLTPDQCEARDNDISDLKRMADMKIRVEPADNPIPDGQAIQRQPSPRIEKRPRSFTERNMDGI